MSVPGVGTIGWIDLTVQDAERVRDFYTAVVGWSASEVKMKVYNDYCMHPAPGAAPVAGICHTCGDNADLPAQWLLYITVADLEASAARCKELGGRVLVGPRSAGAGRYCVIRDPAGAVAALYCPNPA